MTFESLKESVRIIVDYHDVHYIKAIVKSWTRKNDIRKVDRRHSCMKNVYDLWIDAGDSRVTFKYYDMWMKDDLSYNDEHTNLTIVMRKHGGNYIIIGRSPEERLIEIDRTGYEWHYDYEGLKALMEEYPDLFMMLGVKE